LSNGACSGPPREPANGLFGELLDQLHAVDALRELRQDCGLVAHAGADLEHRVGGLQIEQIGHHCDDERLRDRLAEADRQRRVFVGVALHLQRHELVARHLGQGLHDARVQRRLAQLRTRINRLRRDEREHALA
jgi:hypothetical protein